MVGLALGLYEVMVPAKAASMEGRPCWVVAKEEMRRRDRMPACFDLGERPAGAIGAGVGAPVFNRVSEEFVR